MAHPGCVRMEMIFFVTRKLATLVGKAQLFSDYVDVAREEDVQNGVTARLENVISAIVILWTAYLTRHRLICS